MSLVVSSLSCGSALELWSLAVATQIAKLLESCQGVLAGRRYCLICVPCAQYGAGIQADLAV